MLIDFSKIDKKVMPEFYGGKLNTVAQMHVDARNRIMLARLEPGASIGFHQHETGSEIVYFLQGRGKAFYDDMQEEVVAGACHYCPKGHSHSILNDGEEELVFFAVVPQQ